VVKGEEKNEPPRKREYSRGRWSGSESQNEEKITDGIQGNLGQVGRKPKSTNGLRGARKKRVTRESVPERDSKKIERQKRP